VADVALLVIHHLPDDPPTGDSRDVLVGWDDGYVRLARTGVMTSGNWMDGDRPDWWMEVPALPSDPSERLTTNDVEMAANACEDEAREVQSRGSRRGREVWERRARRLRAALPGKEGRTCEP
jgi:hypothetical protein